MCLNLQKQNLLLNSFVLSITCRAQSFVCLGAGVRRGSRFFVRTLIQFCVFIVRFSLTQSSLCTLVCPNLSVGKARATPCQPLTGWIIERGGLFFFWGGGLPLTSKSYQHVSHQLKQQMTVRQESNKKEHEKWISPDVGSSLCCFHLLFTMLMLRLCHLPTGIIFPLWFKYRKAATCFHVNPSHECSF